MNELSSFLDDVFTANQTLSSDPLSLKSTAPPSLPDIPVLPTSPEAGTFLTDETNWMDEEIEAIVSSPGGIYDEHSVHHVSPTTSPLPEKSIYQTPKALNIGQRAPPSPLKRKNVSRKVSLISDGSDSDESSIATSARPTKRARSQSMSSKMTSRPDPVLSAAIPKKVSKSSPAHKKSQLISAEITNSTQPKTIDAATKKKIRREKNREHAKKSRSKKKDFNQALEESVLALREENNKLRRLVYAHFGEQKAKDMVKERIRTPEDNMVESLKQPANKILTKSVVHYLESLRCDVNLHARR
eukprot:scaffold925_cov129-Cylindrotheca_fusiformis.AAC.1